ncbi:sodium-independent sulfate anion transporter-like isoform X2 [Neocloeon triangulifer]|nr:sodium-independent sulfate anion transporter-like isoform X2 [Neocloeon triangulifer]XP_059472278.1 sodium-independent sulfate anion transporter-like isoform X2 [Neocloeon triangulifer]XP_059472279.1 sodium-independent sulfate anion transporter-like isoform X2 [Neocloeon triangulifer]
MQSLLTKRLPILKWARTYDSSCFVADLLAGLTVGLTVIPQGMACAVIAGLEPQYGLYAAFMGCFVYIFFGSCKDITIGPTAISAMLVKPYVDKFGAQVAVLICFLSGCLIFLLGVCQLGFLVDFISMPVIIGFTSAGAISIASSQVAALLGIKGGGHTFLEYWIKVFENIQNTTIWDPVLGFTCIAILLFMKYITKYARPPANRSEMTTSTKIWKGVIKYLSLSRNALVVLFSTVIIVLIMGNGDPPVVITGDIQEGLPHFTLPDFGLVYQNETLSVAETFNELSSAIIIPFVLVLESIAIAKAFANGKTIDATQEMIALGLSNILGSFFQSFPTTGSFTRTAVNNASGVRTPLGGFYTGALVLLCLGLLTSSLKYMPKATLAAVVICAVIFMIEIHEVTMALWKSKKLDLIPLYATFIASLLLGLDSGMIIGIGVNVLFIFYEAARPKLSIETSTLLNKEVILVRPDRSITYPAAEYVKDAVNKQSSRFMGCEVLVVIDGKRINGIDSTAIKVLKSLLDDLRLKNHAICFWNWNKMITDSFVSFDGKDIELFKCETTLEHLLSADDNEEVGPSCSVGDGDTSSCSSMPTEQVWTPEKLPV